MDEETLLKIAASLAVGNDVIELETHKASIIIGLKTLINTTIDECILDAKTKMEEWGQVARTTSFTIKELIKQIDSHKL